MARRSLAALRSYAIETVVVTGVALLLIFHVDLPLAMRLSHSLPTSMTGDPAALLEAISHLGRGEYYLAFSVPGLALGLWLLRRPEQRRRIQGWGILYASTLVTFTLGVGHLLVFLLKQTVARLRPSQLIESGGLDGFAEPFSGEPFTSLPSSHCFTAFAMAAVFSRLKPDLRAVFFGAALLVAVQRMLARHHFLSDIFISLFLALMVSEAVHAAWRAVAAALARRLTPKA